MKKKRLLTMAAAALATSLLMPGTAQARSFSLFNSGSTTITENSFGDDGTPCKDGCTGHTFTGNYASIWVKGGEHTLTFNGVTIDKGDVSSGIDTDAVRINAGATVHLELNGQNKIIGGKNTPGIIVPKDATLEISSDSGGKLTASTYKGEDASGAAGIGGGSYGGTNEVGKIIINGGEITANGRGNGNFPGIGTNKSSGEIILNGGIISTDSSGNDKPYGKAVQGATVTSDTGHFSVVKGTIFGNTANLNTLQSSHGGDQSFTVFGDVVLQNKDSGGIKWEDVENINIPYGASLTLPEKSDNWNDSCNKNLNGNLIYTGNGTIIYNLDSNNLTEQDISDLKGTEISIKVALIAEDFMLESNGRLVYRTMPYTGRDLTNDLLYANKTRGNYEVESLNGWSRTITKDGKEAKFIDAGDYRVTYEKGGRKLELGPITIQKRPLDSEGFQIVIDPKTYTGQPITPDVKASYTGFSLSFEAGEDYTMEYNGAPVTDFTEAGDYSIKFTGIGNNFERTTTGTFTIFKASIDKANVSITVDGEDIRDDTPDTFIYDNKAKKVEIKLTHDGKDLVLNTDYTVTYITNNGETNDPAAADLTNAGEVTILIKGTGNYQDEIKSSFKIKKKKIELQDVTAESRTYDGTNIVKITAAEINKTGLIDQNDDVSIDLSVTDDSPALTAMVEKADIGSYKELTFNAADLTAKLSGSKSGNYAFKGDENGQFTFKLGADKDVVISTAFLSKDLNPVLAGLDENMYAADKDYKLFDYTAQVSNPITEQQFGHTIEYEYQIDDRGWQDEPDFKGIEPDSMHTFYVRTKAVWPDGETSSEKPKERANIAPSDPGELEITFKRLEQDAPDIPNLTFEQNEGSPSFTATINLAKPVPDIPGVEYSFDGKKFSDNPKKDNCTTGTEYIGYIRYKETKTHLPGKIAQSKPTVAPQLMVSKPVITPGSKSFLEGHSVKVTISCDTPGAAIYYTTDGKEPVPGNDNTTLYDGNPILITKSATVRALATEPEMIPAEGEAATYTMVTTSQAHTQYIIKKIEPDVPKSYKIPKTLQKAGLDGIDLITAALFNAIMDSPKSADAPFNYLNMEYFDIKIQFSADGETDWVDATPENFPSEGVTVSLSDTTLAKHSETLKDVDKGDNVFLASHMFTEKHGDYAPGDVEVLDVVEAENALQFTVHGASPMAVAWAKGQDSDGNGGTDEKNTNDKNDKNNNDKNSKNADGTNKNSNTPNVASAAGENQNGDKDGSEDSLVDKAKQLLSHPTTGDTASLLLWIVLGATSFGVLTFAIIKIRKRR